MYFRETRFERMLRFLRLNRKPVRKPRRVAHKPGRQPVAWCYVDGGWNLGFSPQTRVVARTKSEARAQLKRLLNLKRLPAGAVVETV